MAVALPKNELFKLDFVVFVKDDYIRKALGGLASGQGTSSDDLPDYQEQSEQAILDYDIRPSTSHANSGTPLSDDNGDQAAGEEYQAEDEAGDNDQGMDDDDIILIDGDDVSEKMPITVMCC